MNQSIQVNVPLDFLRNTTRAGSLTSKDILDVSWEQKELQAFFLLYSQDTELSNLKARKLFQSKLDIQLASHYQKHPVLPDIPDENYGTYSFSSIHTRKATALYGAITNPAPKPSGRPRKHSKTAKQKKALKKAVLQSLDETVPAFEAAPAAKKVSFVETSPVVEDLKEQKEDEGDLKEVEIEISLTESRIPAKFTTLQVNKPALIPVLHKVKAALTSQVEPGKFLPSELSLLKSAFWYNLSMAQRIERPLGFELVRTGLKTDVLIDRYPGTFDPSYVPSNDQKLLKDCSKKAPSVLDMKGLLSEYYAAGNSKSEELETIKPTGIVSPTESGESSKTKRQRRRRKRYRKSKRSAEPESVAVSAVASENETPTILDLVAIPKSETPKAVEVPSLDIEIPEISDEADSDKDIIEVDSLPVYVEKEKKNNLQVGQLSLFHHFMKLLKDAESRAPKDVVHDEENNLQVGQLSHYHVFMRLLKEAELFKFPNCETAVEEKANDLQVGQLSYYHEIMRRVREAESVKIVPTNEVAVKEEANNLQVGQLSYYHTIMRLLRAAELANTVPKCEAPVEKEVNNLQVGQLSYYHVIMKRLREAELLNTSQEPKIEEAKEEVNNLQVGQLSQYHYFMKLLKLSEYYHNYYKHLPQVRKAIKAYHKAETPSVVVLPGVTIKFYIPKARKSPSTTLEAPKIELLGSPSSISGASESNETSDSSIVSSPEHKTSPEVVEETVKKVPDMDALVEAPMSPLVSSKANSPHSSQAKDSTESSPQVSQDQLLASSVCATPQSIKQEESIKEIVPETQIPEELALPSPTVFQNGNPTSKSKNKKARKQRRKPKTHFLSGPEKARRRRIKSGSRRH